MRPHRKSASEPLSVIVRSALALHHLWVQPEALTACLICNPTTSIVVVDLHVPRKLSIKVEPRQEQQTACVLVPAALFAHVVLPSRRWRR